MGGGGSSTKKASKTAYNAGRAMVDKFTLVGSEKQKNYARDIMKRPFDWIESNVKRQNDLASGASREETKKTYRKFVEEYKEFGRYLSEELYRPNIKKSKSTPIDASSIINYQHTYDGNRLFEAWKRLPKTNK